MKPTVRDMTHINNNIEKSVGYGEGLLSLDL